MMLHKGSSVFDFAVIEDKGDNVSFILWVGNDGMEAKKKFLSYRRVFLKKVFLVRIIANEIKMEVEE